MSKPIPLAELAFQILQLQPISRGAHLAGPLLHARRLIDLWRVDPDAGVPLAQAFRLLDEETVAAAIWHTLAKEEYPGDRRYWVFPPIDDLLAELQQASWHALLAGALLAEGIKGVRGKHSKRPRAVLPAELPRLTPDWELSRFTAGGSDEFIDVRVSRAPATPVADAWRAGKPSMTKVEAAMVAIAQEYSSDAKPAQSEIWNKVKDRVGPEVTRQQMRDALKNVAPHLCGRRGYRSTKSPP